MTAFTLTKNTNIRQLTVAGGYSARSGGDTIANTNGWSFTIDQDTQYGCGSPAIGATTSGSFGSITQTASSGGDIFIDGTKVWLIPYNTGSGTLAPSEAGVTISGITCNTIGLYANMVSAPVLTGVATGWLKVTNTSGTLPSSGTFTSDGFTYTITGAAVRGWIEIVGDDAGTFTGNRLGKFQVRGAYYEIGTTTGTNTDVYNVPNNGKQLWVPSIEVQGATWTITGATYASGSITYTTSATHDMLVGQPVTITGITPSGMNCVDQFITDLTDTTFKVAMADPGSAYSSGGSAIAYELYPCFGTTLAGATSNAVVYNENTRRGKVFWNTNATTSVAAPLGYIRFNHDGTNAGKGGYLPPAGRKIRIPNVIFNCCTTAARNQNVLPNATLATRYDFTMTGAGQIDIDKATMNWYPSFTQAQAVTVTNSGVMSQLSIYEIPTSVVLRNVCIGQEAAVAGITGVNVVLCPAGGTLENVVSTMAATSTSTVHNGIYLATSSNLVVTDCVGWMFGARTGTTKNNQFNLTPGIVLKRFHSIALRMYLLNSANVNVTDTKYTDSTGLRVTGNQNAVFAPEGGLISGVISGLSFVGTRAQPWSAIYNSGANVRGPIKVRSMGTPTAPLATAEGPYYDKSWSRTTTVCTVTHVAHGLVVNDNILVYWNTSTNAITGVLKTVASVPTADTFTFTCLNAGDASGTLTYMFCNTSYFYAGNSSGNCNNQYIQRCYPKNLRTAFVNPDNSHDGLYIENSHCPFDPWTLSNSVFTQLNSTCKLSTSGNGLSPQASVYGSTWVDQLGFMVPDTTSATWARSGSTVTITTASGYHNFSLSTTVPIEVLTSSDEAALNTGMYLVTGQTTAGTTANALKVTGYAAGATSGTCTFTNYTGAIHILMNEGTASNTHYTFTSGNPLFTGAGTLRMPTVGDQAVFESPYWIKGHTGFMNVLPIMSTATIANFWIEYQIDTGSGYGSWKTAFCQTATAVADGTAGAATIVQVAAGDNWIANGDYVQHATTWGEIHRSAKVSSGGGTTTLTMNKNHNTTFSNRALQVYGLNNENASINYTTGFKLKIRITTLIAGTGASNTVGPVMFRTFTTAASRQVQLPLDVVPVTIEVKDSSTLAAVQNARVRITTDVGGYLVLEGLTNASGVLTGTTEYASHAISGTVRRASPADGTLYKPGAISGTTTSSGFSATILMISDE